MSKKARDQKKAGVKTRAAARRTSKYEAQEQTEQT